MIKKNIFSSFIILILLAGNIYLSTQYFSVSKQLKEIKSQSNSSVSTKVQAANVLKEYLDIVLNTQGTTSSDDRIKLENDLRQLQDPAITAQWDAFVTSKDAKSSQENAVKLIALLENKMIQ
ncbi:MAG: hypothetical protein WCV55_03190 [Candidatus Paceibacterota bacterium]